MNFPKFATIIALSVAAIVVGTPLSASAATSSSNQTKAKSLFKKLKKLPNGGASYQTVKSLVNKLTKLDPKKAAKYYKVGVTKLMAGPTLKTQASQLSTVVTKNVQKSGLSTSEIKKINKNVDKEESKVPPYQASLSPLLNYAIA